MKQITMYRTEDGTLFESEKAAFQYEDVQDKITQLAEELDNTFYFGYDSPTTREIATYLVNIFTMERK